MKMEEIHLTCPICHDLFVNPLLCRFCGRSYCRRCIQTWLIQQCKCPVCNTVIHSSSDFIPNRDLRTTLLEYRRSHGLPEPVDNSYDPSSLIPSAGRTNSALDDLLAQFLPPQPPRPQPMRQQQLPAHQIPQRPPTKAEYYFCFAVGLVPIFGPLVNCGYNLFEGDYFHAMIQVGFALLDASIVSSSLAYTNFYLLSQDMLKAISIESMISFTREKIIRDGFQAYLQTGAFDHVARETVRIVLDEASSRFSNCFIDRCMDSLVQTLKTKFVQSLFTLNYFKAKFFQHQQRL